MSIEQYVPRAEVALTTAQDVAVHRLGEWAQSADAAYQIAERLSSSAFVPAQFKGKPVELTAAILAGLEVGLSPMAAMRSFDIIQNQAAPRAITLRAIVQSHGHEMVLEESTASRCKMKGKRRGSEEWQRVTWTLDRARDLGLTGKDGWKKQPTAMLLARATSELARLIASDAILGIGYSAEEVADGGTYEQQVDSDTTTPTAPTGTRKMSRKPRAEQVVPELDAESDSPEPEPEPTPDEPAAADESPLLNTSSPLAKAMYAGINEAGIQEAERLAYISNVIGRDIESTKEMTDCEARDVLAALDRMQAGATTEQP